MKFQVGATQDTRKALASAIASASAAVGTLGKSGTQELSTASGAVRGESAAALTVMIQDSRYRKQFNFGG